MPLIEDPGGVAPYLPDGAVTGGIGVEVLAVGDCHRLHVIYAVVYVIGCPLRIVPV